MQAVMRALRSVLEPGKVPVLFVLGVIALGLATNALYDALKATLGPFSILEIAVLLLIGLVVVAWLARFFVRQKLTVTNINPRRGLVVLVSMPKAVAIAVKRADARKRHSALRERLHTSR